MAIIDHDRLRLTTRDHDWTPSHCWRLLNNDWPLLITIAHDSVTIDQLLNRWWSTIGPLLNHFGTTIVHYWPLWSCCLATTCREWGTIDHDCTTIASSSSAFGPPVTSIDHRYWTIAEPLLTMVEPLLTRLSHHWPLRATIDDAWAATHHYEQRVTAIEPLLATTEPLLTLLAATDHHWVTIEHPVNHYRSTIEPLPNHSCTLVAAIHHIGANIEPPLNHCCATKGRYRAGLVTTVERGPINPFH